MSSILVAEDTHDNQALIEVYMQGTSYVLTFVEDGAAAVEQFREADPDLILMDVRMPFMDGFEATRAIRVIERQRGTAAVPIIALTADVGAEDVALSRQAGCTAYLAKPFSIHELLDTVQTHSLRALHQAVGRDRAAGSPDSVVVEIPEGMEAICPEYLCARRQDCDTLLQLIAEREFERIYTLAHNMKGTGRSYGFSRLTELGLAMEISADGADIARLTGQVADLQQYLRRVKIKAATVGE